VSCRVVLGLQVTRRNAGDDRHGDCFRSLVRYAQRRRRSRCVRTRPGLPPVVVHCQRSVVQEATDSQSRQNHSQRLRTVIYLLFQPEMVGIGMID